jgi:hypothetical protein
VSKTLQLRVSIVPDEILTMGSHIDNTGIEELPDSELILAYIVGFMVSEIGQHILTGSLKCVFEHPHAPLGRAYKGSL